MKTFGPRSDPSTASREADRPATSPTSVPAQTDQLPMSASSEQLTPRPKRGITLMGREMVGHRPGRPADKTGSAKLKDWLPFKVKKSKDQDPAPAHVSLAQLMHGMKPTPETEQAISKPVKTPKTLAAQMHKDAPTPYTKRVLIKRPELAHPPSFSNPSIAAVFGAHPYAGAAENGDPGPSRSEQIALGKRPVIEQPSSRGNQLTVVEAFDEPPRADTRRLDEGESKPSKPRVFFGEIEELYEHEEDRDTSRRVGEAQIEPFSSEIEDRQPTNEATASVGATDVAVQAAASTPSTHPTRRTRPINKLASETRINLSRAPDSTLDDLTPEQLGKLTQALGLGEPSDSPDMLKTQMDGIRNQLRLTRGEFGLLLVDAAYDIKKAKFFKLAKEEKPFGDKTAQTLDRLADLANITHFRLTEQTITDGGKEKTHLNLYFSGSAGVQDARQHVKTAFGGVGKVYKATRELAEIMAGILSASDGRYEINRIAGISLGGGTAQAFTAALQGRIKLERDPALVLLDPQLLNNAQAAHATRHGEHDYAYDKLRGVAITLDYKKNPRRGLMNVMKGVGRYKSPGLVQLRLGLKLEDGPKVSQQKPPRPSGVTGLGYHDSEAQYLSALNRFLDDLPKSRHHTNEHQAPPLQPESSPSSLHSLSRMPSELEIRPGISEIEVLETSEPSQSLSRARSFEFSIQADAHTPSLERLRRAKPINKLPSERKIDLSRSPDSTVDDLTTAELAKLTMALGLGEPSESPEIRQMQKGWILKQMAITEADMEAMREDPKGLALRKTNFFKLAFMQVPFGENTDKTFNRLEQLADITHFSLAERTIKNRRTGEERILLDFHFAGTENLDDVKQDIETAVGGVGDIYKATRELAEIMAGILKACGDNFNVNRILGFSMGGGTAQAFTAALQSRIELDTDPTLLLFDPQLLTDAQAKYATKGGEYEYSYDKLRGVAITLDYDKKPRRGLMNLMKAAGYKSPGLVQLRLGLKEEDGNLKTPKTRKEKAILRAADSRLAKLPKIGPKLNKLKDKVENKLKERPPRQMPPKPFPMSWFGYHGDGEQFILALGRFLQPLAPPPPQNPS